MEINIIPEIIGQANVSMMVVPYLTAPFQTLVLISFKRCCISWERPNASRSVKHLEGNVYRAREGLEMFDAAALRVESTIDVPIYFYTALCIEEKKIGPMAELVFEKATVQYDGENFISLWDDGKKTLYERDEDASSMKKLYDCITAVRNNDTPCCVLNSVKSHMDVVIALQDIEVQTVASVDYLTDTGERVQVIPGGIDQFVDAYKQWSMPNIENIPGNA